MLVTRVGPYKLTFDIIPPVSGELEITRLEIEDVAFPEVQPSVVYSPVENQPMQLKVNSRPHEFFLQKTREEAHGSGSLRVSILVSPSTREGWLSFAFYFGVAEKAFSVCPQYDLAKSKRFEDDPALRWDGVDEGGNSLIEAQIAELLTRLPEDRQKDVLARFLSAA